MAKAKLTNKQELFCQEYMKTGNKSEAYRRAYDASNMSENSINVNASKMNNNAKVALRIKELQKEVSERNKITVDECVSLLASMARFDIADLYDTAGNLKPIHDIPKDTRLVIESIDTDEITAAGKKTVEVKKLKLSNRRANIIELMKHLGGYNEDNKQKEVSINLISLGKGLNPE
ncbi:MAG: terminase small subunit [Lactobacillus helveticus]